MNPIAGHIVLYNIVPVPPLHKGGFPFKTKLCDQ